MATTVRFTTDHLLALPEIEGVRYEIIDGELFVSRSPHWHHQFASTRLGGRLDVWSERTGLGLALATPGVVMTLADAVIPDIVWIAAGRLGDAFDSSGHIQIAPDLVVEVLSPGADNERRDLEAKLGLYDRIGVREYWIISWEQRMVWVHRRLDGRLRHELTMRDGDALVSPLLPGFACAVVDLWPRQ
jgi:Uma2 family endonuclease